MKLIAMVATSIDGGIGFGNDLPWHIPSDLKRFKQRTKGKPVIMGRNTFDSIGRVLPERLNIVISKGYYVSSDNLVYVKSLDEAVNLVRAYDEAFLIGGSSVYAQALAHQLIDEIDLTVINEKFECDKYFDFDDDLFLCLSENTTVEDGYNITRYIYRKTVNTQMSYIVNGNDTTNFIE